MRGKKESCRAKGKHLRRPEVAGSNMQHGRKAQVPTVMSFRTQMSIYYFNSINTKVTNNDLLI